MLDLSCVKSTAKDVRIVLCARGPLKGKLPFIPPSDDLTVELILRTIIEVQRTSFTLQHVVNHFYQTWQVKFDLGIACYVFDNIEESDCVLDAVSRFNIEVIFL